MQSVEAVLLLCLQLMQCVPVYITGLPVTENMEPLPRPMARRSADWSSYWAAHHAQQAIAPDHGYHGNFHHIPTESPGLVQHSFTDSVEVPKLAKPPLYIWRFTPIQRNNHASENRAQPLNTWLGEKIAVHAASPSEYNGVWEATLLSEGRAESAAHREYPVKTTDDIIVGSYENQNSNFDPYYFNNNEEDRDLKAHYEGAKNKDLNMHSHNYHVENKAREQSWLEYASAENSATAGLNGSGNEKVNLKPSNKGNINYGDETSSKLKPTRLTPTSSTKTSNRPDFTESTTKSVFSPGYRQGASKNPGVMDSHSGKYQNAKNLHSKKNVPEFGSSSEVNDYWEDCGEECESDYTDFDDSSDSSSNDFDQEKLKRNFVESLDNKFRALVFNPMADSSEIFQPCKTPSNETGNCRYIQHCLLSSIIGGIPQFMNYVCIINDRFIGVCCPEFPVSEVQVKWEESESTSSEESTNDTMTAAECGHSSKTRIVGGSKADPADYPWMAALITMDKGQFFCGGSVINDRYILTAAHCTFGIPRDQILVRLGEYDFGHDNPEFPGEDYPVVEIKRHGLYSRRTLKHDIAVLKLGRRIEFNQRVGTICFPQKDEDFVGQTATLAGWGNTKGGGPSSEVLLEAALHVVNNSICAENHGLPVPSTFICTHSDDDKRGACNGDSGGPLMLMNEETKEWKIIGLVSWGRRGCEPKFPTVYTKITEYLDWIEAHSSE